MVKTGEAFFSSLGFEPLPETFWERSQIVKPEGREVVCHASAWDLDARDDLRIKMCIDSRRRGLPHDPSRARPQLLSARLQGPAEPVPRRRQRRLSRGDRRHDHAVDHARVLCSQIGLIDTVPDASKDIGLLLQQALDGVAFLPFGLLIDKWRWQVFSGELTPETYNSGWWALRTQYQGVRPPNERPRGRVRSRRQVPHPRQHAVHALLPRAHPPVPVLQSGLRRGGLGRAAASLLVLRLEGSRRSPERDARARPVEALARRARSLHGRARDGWRRRSSPTTSRLSAWLKEQNAGKTCGW